MTHVEFEMHFAEQAERFGISKIIRQRGEEYAFQSFMLAMSGIVARNEPKPIDEDELDKLARKYAEEEYQYDLKDEDIDFHCCIEDFKAGYRKAWEDKQ